MTNVVLIGAGNMGFAMAEGWLRNLPDLVLHVVEPHEPFRQRANALGAKAVPSLADLAPTLSPHLVIIAVKPQLVLGVLADARTLAMNGAACLSVAAGVRLATKRAALGAASPLIRCMPNTPAAIGEGMMVLYADEMLPPSTRDLAETLMAASGAVAWIEDEALMDAVTAISGSGPAYVFHFVEALTEAGSRLGLPDQTAALLARQTVAGAGRMAAQAATSPNVLREQVTSPNGTTAAALAVLMDGLTDLVVHAAIAARDRSVELGRAG